MSFLSLSILYTHQSSRSPVYFICLLVLSALFHRANSSGLNTSTTIIPIASSPSAASLATTSIIGRWTPTPLSLPITSAPPDPRGIPRVSGFYGPGAWAAWSLTLAASWFRLPSHHPQARFDLSTWIYLLGTDWAAFDLIYISCSLQTLKRSNASSEVFDAEIGSIGAAFSIAFWGTAHADRLLSARACS